MCTIFVVFNAHYAVFFKIILQFALCRDLRAFAWRKIEPKNVTVEKKGQISCVCWWLNFWGTQWKLIRRHLDVVLGPLGVPVWEWANPGVSICPTFITIFVQKPPQQLRIVQDLDQFWFHRKKDCFADAKLTIFQPFLKGARYRVVWCNISIPEVELR